MRPVVNQIRRHLLFVDALIDRVRNAERVKSLQGRTPEEVFTGYYHSEHWKGHESVSGKGSDFERTREIRRMLPAILDSYRIRTLLDVPCGDFNWMKHVSLPAGVSYIGGDIVAEMVERNQEAFGGESVHFVRLNLIEDDLPSADLLFCRDCMVHLSMDDLKRVLANVRRSNIRYLLATTFTQWLHNRDILTGQWRPLNLEKPPFSWPRPIAYIREPTMEGGGFSDKALGLWRVADLPPLT